MSLFRKASWVFATAVVLVGIGSIIWPNTGTINISEVIASCREDASRVCASEVAEGGTGMDLEDIHHNGDASTIDNATLSHWTSIVDCLRRQEHLLYRICRYNLSSFDSRDNKYSDERAHQRKYAVAIIVFMYSIIPIAALVYSLYTTVRIQQLQSTVIRLSRSRDGASGRPGSLLNDHIESIGFHYDDCAHGRVLFEVEAGTLNVIIKHDDGEGCAIAARVLSELAGRAIERGSAAIVYTVNSRLMARSDYRYVRPTLDCIC